jgi:hypothetical protein
VCGIKGHAALARHLGDTMGGCRTAPAEVSLAGRSLAVGGWRPRGGALQHSQGYQPADKGLPRGSLLCLLQLQAACLGFSAFVSMSTVLV